MTIEDKKIIQLFWDRTEEALIQTRMKYANYCYAIAFRILQSKEDADECLNDALLRVWNAIPPAKPNHLSIFLGKITRNLALNYVEKMQAQKRGGGVVTILLSELEDCLPSNQHSPEGALDDQYTLEVLNRFLDNTNLSHRKLFVRRYWYGSSIKEISEDLGYSESKVTTILYRLRKKLKETFEKEGVTL